MVFDVEFGCVVVVVVDCCVLFVDCHLFVDVGVVRCSLLVVGCGVGGCALLAVVGCLLFIDCCVLVVIWSLLTVVCRLL